MDRFAEIEERLAAIATELDSPEADLDALEAEVTSLKDERAALEAKAQKRAALIADVVSSPGPVIHKFEERKMHETVFTRDSEEYRVAWLKRLQGNELNEIEQRAYATGDSANAVPTLVADKFFEKLKKLAPMMSEITLLRVPGNLKFAVEGTNNAAAAHTQNTAVSPAADTIVNVTLGGTEFVKVITISMAVKAMSIGAFEDWLVQMLSRDIARAIDNYIINDSSNGIAVCTTWTSGTNQIVNTTGLSYANMVSLISLLPAGYDPNAKMLMNKRTLWQQVANLVDSAGQPILLRDVENGFAPRVLGYPVIVDDYVTTANGAIYLGDFEQVVGNLSQDVTVDASDQSAFRSAGIDYRGYALFDSKVALTDAIVRFVTTTA